VANIIDLFPEVLKKKRHISLIALRPWHFLMKCTCEALVEAKAQDKLFEKIFKMIWNQRKDNFYN
jgi:hypothetical protein